MQCGIQKSYPIYHNLIGDETSEFEETETQTGGPSTGEIIKHAGLFKGFAGMNINRTPSPDPAEARAELLEKYNALLKVS